MPRGRLRARRHAAVVGAAPRCRGGPPLRRYRTPCRLRRQAGDHRRQAQLGLRACAGPAPWAKEITFVSPRPVQTALLALSALRVRYLQPYDEYVRGGSGTNARVLARHIAAKHLGIHRERHRLERDEVVPLLLGELARAPELWIQKGYLARAVTLEPNGIRDEGIVPLAHFVDEAGPDAVAVSVEVDAAGKIIPVVYVRTGGRVVEHLLASHPLHAFDGVEQRAELEARLRPLLG